MANMCDVRMPTNTRDRARDLATRRRYPPKTGAGLLITAMIEREAAWDSIGLGPKELEEAIRDYMQKRLNPPTED
ncbi:MAG: hypothetical protein AAF078_06270 [Planctomycetota bacterium]